MFQQSSDATLLIDVPPLDAPLIDADAIAKRFGVHRATVTRWAQRGEIPAIRIGPKLLRFDLAAVLKALAAPQGRAGASTPPRVAPPGANVRA